MLLVRLDYSRRAQQREGDCPLGIGGGDLPPQWEQRPNDQPEVRLDYVKRDRLEAVEAAARR